MKFLKKKPVASPPPARNGYNAAGTIIKFYKWAYRSGGLRRTAPGRGRGQDRNKKVDSKSENKKRTLRTQLHAAAVVSVCSSSTSIISSSTSSCFVSTSAVLHSYRRYKQTAGHTGEVTNAGHLHLAARVAFSLSSSLCFFSLSFSLTLFPRHSVRLFSVVFFLFSRVLSPPSFPLSLFHLSGFAFPPLSLSFSPLFAGWTRLVTRTRVCAGCIMYGGSVQSTVNTASAFLALANFPLLNVNFSVIDGTRCAGLPACSVWHPLPFPSIEPHHRRTYWSNAVALVKRQIDRTKNRWMYSVNANSVEAISLHSSFSG